MRSRRGPGQFRQQIEEAHESGGAQRRGGAKHMRLGRPMRGARGVDRRRADDLLQKLGGAKVFRNDRGRRELRQRRLHGGWIGEVGLGQHDAVGERDLTARLAVAPQRVDAVDDASTSVTTLASRKREARLASANSACRIGPGSARPEVSTTTIRRNARSRASNAPKPLDEIAAQGAAQAAGGKQRNFAVEPLVKPMVERRRAEFVDHDQRFRERRIAQQSVEERRLACAEKAGEQMQGRQGPTGTSLPTNTGGPDGLPFGEPPCGSTVTAYVAARTAWGS